MVIHPLAASREQPDSRAWATSVGSRPEMPFPGQGVQAVLIVAAIQPESLDDDPAGNLDRAEALVREAAGRGARIVLCPELLAAGNRLDKRSWAHAEPFSGRTVAWLRRVAREHSIVIGASFLEARGGEFVNTFVLVEPDGEIAGIVRKRRPPTWERFFSTGVRGRHTIDTQLGRIGVGICAETRRRFLDRDFRRSSPELILMPHAESMPNGRPLCDVTAERYARRYGVPVLLANKAGRYRVRLPLLPLRRIGVQYTGRSAVCDAGAARVTALDTGPGLVVQPVRLGTRDPRPDQRTRRRWTRARGVDLALSPLTGLVALLGWLSYRADPRRRRIATEIGAQQGSSRRGPSPR